MSLNRTRRAAAADSDRSPGAPAGPAEEGGGDGGGGGAGRCGDRFVLCTGDGAAAVRTQRRVCIAGTGAHRGDVEAAEGGAAGRMLCPALQENAAPRRHAVGK
jgi:hypothetical protein